jgi:hypothetical protein
VTAGLNLGQLVIQSLLLALILPSVMRM